MSPARWYGLVPLARRPRLRPEDADHLIGEWNFVGGVRGFQQSFGWWAIPMDGHLGEETLVAVSKVVAEKGRLSPNFHMDEFRSRATNQCLTHRELLWGLEEVRKAVGPIGILHSVRTPEDEDRIRAQGDRPAANSQHRLDNGCTAVDLDPMLPFDVVRGVNRFSGIGCHGEVGGPVRHVDVRHAGPNNTTGSTPDNPAIWPYPS